MNLVLQNLNSVTLPQISPYLVDSPFGFAWATLDTSEESEQRPRDEARAAISRSKPSKPTRAQNIRQRFTKLAQRWRAETLYSSVLEDKLAHPAYQEIIEMGEDVIPLILDELRKRPSHWFQAIDSIVGRPILPEDFSGGFADAVAAYEQWGTTYSRT